MQTFRLATGLILAGIFTLFFAGCEKEEAREFTHNNAYNRYISSYTSGEVFCTSEIRVTFKDPVAQNFPKIEPLEKMPFSFRPGISGNAWWIDDYTLEFDPEKPLPHDTYFKGELDLREVLPEVEPDLKTFPFQFATRKQTLSISVNTLNPVDEESRNFYRLDGTLYGTDYIDPEILPELLTAELEGQELDLKWSGDNNFDNYFTIDSLPRKELRGVLTLKWNGRKIGVDEKGERQIYIPALGDFQVEDLEVHNSPTQYVSIRFSDPLKKSQDLEGLATLGNEKVKYGIYGTELRIYPKSRVRGTYKLFISRNLKNSRGYEMQKPYEQTLEFEELKPGIRLVGRGNIIPQGNTLPFAFETVGLKGVTIQIRKVYEDNVLQFLQVNSMSDNYEMHRVGVEIYEGEIELDKEKRLDLLQWNRHAVDLSRFIQPEPGAIYEISLGMKKEFSTYTCPEEEEDPEEYEDYWERRENPCRKAYYEYYDKPRRNILASDLGIMVKRSENDEMLIIVNDLRTTQPMPGVQVDFYDYQQQRIRTVTTDFSGHAKVKMDEMPFVLVAKKGRQRGYLKLNGGYALSVSNFNVQGKRHQEGVKGYIYGERGVWRPGDTLHLTFVLEDQNHALPKDHPVTFELEDPNGKTVKKTVSDQQLNGFYAFKAVTSHDAPTGNYQLSVNVGNSWFHKSLKVETVIPNRLKIEPEIPLPYLSRSPQADSGKLEVRWLHGAIAKNLKVDLSCAMHSASTHFKDYRDYTFTDPNREYDSDWLTLLNGNLDENGVAEFPLSLDAGEEAPGMLRADFAVKVFEPGGSFSKDHFSLPFHPYDQYVGLKTPKVTNWSGNLETEKSQEFSIALVDRDGKPVKADSVTVEFYQLSWKWWWSHSARRISSYNGKFYQRQVERKRVAIKDGKGTWKTRVKDEQYGRYLVRVLHQGGHAASTIVYFDWDEYLGASNSNATEGATMLPFTADQKKYNVGETITLNIPAGGAGKALISLESGTEVVRTFWMDAKKGLNKFTFRATADLAPNVYAHVTLIQPHSQVQNDLPVRMYGIVPIMVEDPATHLQPILRMPDLLRPEEKVSLTVSEKRGRPMTYTIAVVDEGLLDLTRFHTPDPWSTFYAREALGVSTYDLYDQVLGNQSEGLKLLSIGGDGSAAQQEGAAKVNRFKPVVRFLGPFELKPGQKRNHSFEMPRYVGSVKTMVVAGDPRKSAYGSAEKVTPVRKPLMVLGTLPRVLGPEESLNFPVSVFAMEDEVKNATIELEYSEHFKLNGPARQTLTFDRPGDELVEFPIEVKDFLGVGKLTVTATSGKEKAVFEIDVEIRTPNTRITDFVEQTVKPGESGEINVNWLGMEGTNEATLEVTTIPPLNLASRMGYLVRYPHGCVEQTTSSVFPQLYLSGLTDLDKKQKRRINQNLKAGVKRLGRFQTTEGGLAYWPGSHRTDDWATNYAGAFLIEAKNNGYKIPAGLLAGWVRFQQNKAGEWTTGTKQSELIQADRLFLLALAGKPEMGAMNRMKERTNQNNVASWRLAGAYHLAGRPEIARKIAHGLSIEVPRYRERSHTYGSDLRDKALILETLSIMGEKQRAEPLMEEISKALSSREWYSTQTVAYCLVAAAKYSGRHHEGAKFEYTVQVGDAAPQKIISQKPISQQSLSTDGMQGANIRITNPSQVKLYTRVIHSGIPKKDSPKEICNNLDLRVNYWDMDGHYLDPRKIEQGTDFYVDVTLVNPGGKGSYDEMALTQIFPSGWEIINSRIDGVSYNQGTEHPDYQDIRDDRVHSYFDLHERESNTYRVLLNAAYAGRFYLPAVYAEAMYDNEIAGRKPGMWIEVSKSLEQ